MDRRRNRWNTASEDTLLLVKSDMSGELAAAKENSQQQLTFCQKLAYGVGHVLNDNCAAVWFSYTLLYFQVIMGMPQSMTGGLLLVGQVVDAFATPIVGIFADRTGRRKIWHLAGTICTIVSFPLIFLAWPGYSGFSLHKPENQTSESDGSVKGSWMIGLYYTALITVFQTGWAIVQIAHLALIPIMTPLQSEREELTAIRFSASICSSIFMYLVTWFTLHENSEKVDTSPAKKLALGPGDAYKFRDTVLIGTAIGTAFSAWFQIALKAPDDVAKKKGEKPSAEKCSAGEKNSIKGYLTSLLLYQVSTLYVSSRLFITLSLVYVPLYLVENVGEKADFLATVPLVFYIASFVSSLIVKQINPCLGSKFIYLIGGIASILACVWIGIGLGRISMPGELFSVAVLLGTGSSITMVSSLCLTADFIGTETEHGAFVYSVVTFADKLLNGIVVMIIEEMKCKDCSHYYQDVLAYVCGATVLLGLIALASMEVYPFSFSKLKETIKKIRISRN